MTTPPSSPTDNTLTQTIRRAPVEELTRASVCAVFKDMLNLEMVTDEPLPLAEEEAGQIISSVGFIGQATGIVHLYTGVAFAKTVTSRMLGLEEAEVEGDEMLNDALAELGNVVVGGVKSRLCDQGWACTLTIPSVLRGHHLRVESIADAPRTVIGFRVGNHRMLVEVLLKDPEPGN